MDITETTACDRHETDTARAERQAIGDAQALLDNAVRLQREGDAARLSEIEEELTPLMSQRGSSWAGVYKLLDEVEVGSLWRAASPPYKSMSAWMASLAVRAGVQVTYLRRAQRAGRAYERYAEAKARAGQCAPKMEEAPVGDEMLADIERISDGDAAKEQRYIDAAMAGRLDRRTVKDIIAGQPRRRAGRKSDAERARRARQQEADQTGEEAGVTAEDILLAIRPQVFYGPEQTGRRMLKGQRLVWRRYAEMPCWTGVTDHPMRMDACIITNADTALQNEVEIVQIEIKVSLHDLVGDDKHLAYSAFSDRDYFAVPAGLEEAAREVAERDSWGLLVFNQDKGQLRVAREAPRGGERGREDAGLLRQQTLAAALIKDLPALRSAL